MSNFQKAANFDGQSEPTNTLRLRGQAYIGLGKEAKRQVFYNLSSESSIEYDVLPSENGQIPQLKITQNGKHPIFTTDYYYTNIPTKLLMIIAGIENKDTSPQQGTAAPLMVFAEDPLEAGEIRITAQEVHRQSIPFLDLRQQNITSLDELKAAFNNLVLCKCPRGSTHKSHGRKEPK